MRGLKLPALQVLVHILALAPLIWLVWLFSQSQLGANPIREIQIRTGRDTLNLLVLTLACTPVYDIFGFKLALQLRRTIGLYTFVYAGLHFLNFVGLDYGFNLRLLWKDIADKRFAFVGFAAFLLLLPLAVTSTAGWMRRLGKNWWRLHRLIYVVAGLAIFHFVWQVKSRADLGRPLIYAGIIVILLIVRIPKIRELMRRRAVNS